ncbi:histidine ammonia-lyase [Pontixanthobacter aestiaquae]|uniref:Histidine ammonia-lyase n=1 Tax=Pontixanthobacter aestiaquae TaxID=1509367 RepID=A0A844Z120_9SPHN|nr:histidine ammonia-lyase [Pontixanthobacter aestiaquae]MDN3646594.1 histidine ammonia-lyase [Pontixanthobacter aestiaquae]MXO82421.1 histidine ammonia-lyase [Pontixanthobacter aestiaquae]
MTITLTPGAVSLAALEQLYRDQPTFVLDDTAYTAVRASASILAARIGEGEPIYGVNTGFGKLASVRIEDDRLADLQRNLVRSHAAGFGPPLPETIVRLIMALKCISLGRGASGVRPEVIDQLQAMAAAGVIPVIPEKGSVGASGDLAPLAHMAAAMMGEGDAFYQSERMAAGEALQAAGLTPIELQAKEGLALLNGTQASTALALVGLFEAWHLAKASLCTAALSIDAAMGSSAPFHPDIHDLRGHRGQIESAARLRSLLGGSEIRESHKEGDERVQDPYCLRCAPQVIGACLDQLRHAAKTLEIEANAATDNPLVLSDGAIVSGGNFHAEPVALVADLIAIAISEIGAIAQRRVALLVDPSLSFGLPAFLAPDPGLKSGLMIAEVTSAALMSENKALANPRSVDSTPTSANQEDHVSMACHAARRLLEMNRNLAGILGVEAMAAAQGIELRAPLKTSDCLQDVIATIRQHSPALTEDRIVSDDLEKLANLVSNQTCLAEAACDVAPMNL